MEVKEQKLDETTNLIRHGRRNAFKVLPILS